MNKPRAIELTTGDCVGAETYRTVRASLQQLLLRTGNEWWIKHSAVGQAYAVLRKERQAITDPRFIKVLQRSNLFKKGSSEALTIDDVVNEETAQIIRASVQRDDQSMISGFSSVMVVVVPVYSLVENPVRPEIAAGSAPANPKGMHLRK